MNAPVTMRARVERYLAERRHAGYALRIEGQQLLRFAEFAEQCGHQGPLTLDLAVRWATASPRPSPLTAPRRLEVLRGLARFWQHLEPGTQVPPRRLLGRGHRRLTPHIYTEGEIRALLNATKKLHPPGSLRALCCRAIFGLIAATGLRLSEATGLTREDVDLAQGVLLIRHTKFGKSRWVPLHPTTTRVLRRYAQIRDRDPRAAPSEAFFVGDAGRPARPRNIEYAFAQLRRRLQWTARGGHPAPRIQDLRHTFVCRTLQRWYADGLDIDRHILALSTYVGHAKVTDTYWYVTAIPDLMAIAARRFEYFAEGMQP
ncbi:MAG: tyrosine-type recombinase/integrase [Gammaproteobacteria bacterium]|nr:tyrosine-type recombinase/integrase [Gammaproteobacteria bacterium]